MFNNIHGIVNLQVMDKKSGDVILEQEGNNTITDLWKVRLNAHLGGFGGIDIGQIRPFEMIAYSSQEGAEYGLSSLSGGYSGTTSVGASGYQYFEDGALDVTYNGNSFNVVYKGDFSPTDSAGIIPYNIQSLRLATSAGAINLTPGINGGWSFDQYAPVAVFKVDPPIVVIPGQILIVRWSLNFG